MEKLTLNLGCGERVYKEYPEGYKCINMDNRANLPDVDLVGDVKVINFPDNTFDYILASDIIEHFPITETKGLLLEWKRALKPEGTLEIRTPNLKFLTDGYARNLTDQNHPHRADFFSYHMFGGQDYSGNFHYVTFDRSWLSGMCEGCGLEEFDYEEIGQNFIMKVEKKKGNIILRPVYNRPEMLALSIEYEKKAREYYGGVNNVTTLFLVEYGAHNKVLELIDEYPFPKEVIKRDRKMGLTINILEGMKIAFSKTDSFIIYMEDDILIHKTYFNYMSDLMKMLPQGTYSVLSPYNGDDAGSVNEVYKSNHYAALAPLITKKFFNDYIYNCATPEYYNNPPAFITKLNNKYKEYWGKGPGKYKYRDSISHHEQAGCIHRLCNIAMIEEGMHVIMPRVNRQQHIGYFGKNRPGGIIPGNSYDERLKNLREIIKDANKMYEMSSTKQYRDYKVFSPKLDAWDGTLEVV